MKVTKVFLPPLLLPASVWPIGERRGESGREKERETLNCSKSTRKADNSLTFPPVVRRPLFRKTFFSVYRKDTEREACSVLRVFPHHHAWGGGGGIVPQARPADFAHAAPSRFFFFLHHIAPHCKRELKYEEGSRETYFASN